MSKVISRKQMPTRLPFVGTAFWLVVMDIYNAPGWVWGVVVTLMVIGWGAIIFSAVKEEQCEVKL